MVTTLNDTKEAYAELINFLSEHDLAGYLINFSEDSQARMSLIMNELLVIQRSSKFKDTREWAALMLDCIRLFVQEAAIHDRGQEQDITEQEEKIEELQSLINELKSQARKAS